MTDLGNDGEQSPTSPISGEGKFILGAALTGAVAGAALGGPIGAYLGLRVAGGLAKAGVECRIHDKVSATVDELRLNAYTLRKTSSLTPARLNAVVEHLNIATVRYTASHGFRIVFSVHNDASLEDAASSPEGRVSGVAEERESGDVPPATGGRKWRKSVLVKCRVVAVEEETDSWTVMTTRKLTLLQFVFLHEQILTQIALDITEEENEDYHGDDDGIAVSTGVVDDMGFEHLEIAPSPRRQPRRRGESGPAASNESVVVNASPSAPVSDDVNAEPSSLTPTAPPDSIPSSSSPPLSVLPSAPLELPSVSRFRFSPASTPSEGSSNAHSPVSPPNTPAAGRTLQDLSFGAVSSKSDAASSPPPSKRETSPDAKKGATAPRDKDVCCICMEAEAVVVLPCYHVFCDTCIESWVASRRSTCPLCRAHMGRRNDRWEVVEGSGADFDVKSDIGAAMLHLASHCGKSDGAE